MAVDLEDDITLSQANIGRGSIFLHRRNQHPLDPARNTVLAAGLGIDITHSYSTEESFIFIFGDGCGNIEPLTAAYGRIDLLRLTITNDG